MEVNDLSGNCGLESKSGLPQLPSDWLERWGSPSRQANDKETSKVSNKNDTVSQIPFKRITGESDRIKPPVAAALPILRVTESQQIGRVRAPSNEVPQEYIETTIKEPAVSDLPAAFLTKWNIARKKVDSSKQASANGRLVAAVKRTVEPSSDNHEHIQVFKSWPRQEPRDRARKSCSFRSCPFSQTTSIYAFHSV